MPAPSTQQQHGSSTGRLPYSYSGKAAGSKGKGHAAELRALLAQAGALSPAAQAFAKLSAKESTLIAAEWPFSPGAKNFSEAAANASATWVPPAGVDAAGAPAMPPIPVFSKPEPAPDHPEPTPQQTASTEEAQDELMQQQSAAAAAQPAMEVGLEVELPSPDPVRVPTTLPGATPPGNLLPFHSQAPDGLAPTQPPQSRPSSASIPPPSFLGPYPTPALNPRSSGSGAGRKSPPKSPISGPSGSPSNRPASQAGSQQGASRSVSRAQPKRPADEDGLSPWGTGDGAQGQGAAPASTLLSIDGHPLEEVRQLLNTGRAACDFAAHCGLSLFACLQFREGRGIN